MSLVWISSTSEHRLLASQVSALLTEELTMKKILKLTSISTEFYDVKNLNKYSQFPIRLELNFMTELNSNIILVSKYARALTLLPLSQSLYKPYHLLIPLLWF